MRRASLILASLIAALCGCSHVEDYDLCIYGGTASGVVAADAAARMGLNVIVIEPTCRLGGMTTGGLGMTDIGNKQVVKGLSLKFYRELGRHYGNLENWVFEPGAAAEVLAGFADSPRIRTLTDYHLCDASLDGTKITSIRVSDSRDTLEFSARWFLDCSYEGDLMACSGVSYRVGREDNSEYGETWNGSQLLTGHQFPDGVDPFVEPGNPDSGLLWGISTGELHEDGTGDDLVQAYNYRICLTDSLENRIPIRKPDNYDPSRYELLLRLFDAQPDKRQINQYFIWSMMPNRKTDVNNRGAFSTDMIGMNHDYPEASWERRQEILEAHKDYTLGLLYFIGNDVRVPSVIRDYVHEWGLPKDEYTECGNWTPQLYIRESRRLVGEYVATQADCENRVVAPEGVAYAAYTMDSHNCERIVVLKDGRYMVKNEGNAEIHGGLPYPISYRSITPKADECTNLLVPVCCSASHIAYGSIRMEPVFMCLGQAAGIAVGLAEKHGLARVQDVNFKEINEIIDKDPYMDGTAPDIVIDDPDAEVHGQGWELFRRTGGYGPSFYCGSAAEGHVVFETIPGESGEYDLYTYQNLKLSDLSPTVVFDLSDGRTVTVNLSDVVVTGQTTSAWHKLTEVELRKGEAFSVSVHGDGGQGRICADAILLVRR